MLLSHVRKVYVMYWLALLNYYSTLNHVVIVVRIVSK